MKCPYCHADNDRVIDSRTSQDGFTIRRRRECAGCRRRYTTYERIEEMAIKVVKKDGVREPFAPEKLRHFGPLLGEVGQPVDLVIHQLVGIVPVLDGAGGVEELRPLVDERRAVADVVDHHVEHDLHAARAGLPAQDLERIGLGDEAGILAGEIVDPQRGQILD